MATVETDIDGAGFVAIWHTIHGQQRRHFDTRAELNIFALKKMGKTGCWIDNTGLTPEQRKDWEDRQARAREVMAGLTIRAPEQPCCGGAE